MSTLDIVIYCGIFVFSLTGALNARAHHMDIFGAIVLAFVTSYGGGSIRDIVMDARPINWMNDNLALALVITPVIIISLVKFNFNRLRRLIFFTDAVGLGLFTVAGIDRSAQFGANEPYSLLMGVVTATFGGLIADILCNNVPNLLRRGELYATACAIGGAVYILSKRFVEDSTFSLIICICLIVIIRIISKYKKVMLPEV
ncbi:trimeric intracellular cation channel family protein [Haoranjiania flava]|uniref:TRIC cation channel family protein n=1 Tax=Haoranjiania flava TaxID=1856322 RepID=A0AAE3LMJ4_9BACT|nr:TRIC cation channel family protein [Haoranjiania flava]MCU7693941.1 TRIC cation channel family protein [Haoranjiania flava]